MFTFIAFLFTIAGSVNWLLIGLLQYDYIAGFFGFQAALMSRIFYVLFGIGAVYLVLRVIINKGTFKIWERKKKKEKEDDKALEKEEKRAYQNQANFQPAYANIEASREQIPQSPHEAPTQENMAQSQNHTQFVDFGKLREFRTEQNVDAPNFENEQSAKKGEKQEFAQNSSSPSAPENFFEPPQEQKGSETLFDEHMNMRK